MLNASLAGHFVEQLSACTDYNVNVMDENGIIIASRDAGRVRSYHEAAHRMLRSGQERMAVADDGSYPGVKSGVNLLVCDGGRPVGVVGVTGPPEKVQEIALVIKMALESMLRYERQQEDLYSARTAQERFYTAVFMEEDPELERLEALAAGLRLQPRRLRAPILIERAAGQERDALLSCAASLAAEQDMVWAVDGSHVLVCRDLGAAESAVLSRWRGEVSDFLDRLAAACDYKHAFVGTMQCRLHCYRKSLDHCRWLEEHVVPAGRNVFFMDYIDRYIPSLLPAGELHSIWNAYGQCLDEKSRQELEQTVGPLRAANYNMAAASQALFVHKNTLAFRMNKLRQRLDIDPFRSGADRLFLDCLYFYLKRNP